MVDFSFGPELINTSGYSGGNIKFAGSSSISLINIAPGTVIVAVEPIGWTPGVICTAVYTEANLVNLTGTAT